MKKIISVFCVLGLMGSFAFANLLLFNGFEPPYTASTNSIHTFSQYINTPAVGASQLVTIDSTTGYNSSHALKWVQQAPSTGSWGNTYNVWQDDYSTQTSAPYSNVQNFSGATVLSAWMFWALDTVGAGPNWTIQFWIRDTAQRTDLGNWNENDDTTAIYYNTWYYRQWPSPTGPSNLSGILLNQVIEVGCYTHPNDFANWTTANGSITVWIDDVEMEGPTIGSPLSYGPQISPSSANLKPFGSQPLTVSGTSGPYTWSLSTSNLGSLNTNSGATVIFSASSTFGTVTVTVTDGNSAQGTATIKINPASAPLAVDSEMKLYDHKVISRKDYELFE
jgi:hypothetical protein